MVLILALIFLSSAQILEYRFWMNYGETIYDYSGNKLHGSSGSGVGPDSYDCLFTDRGVYSSTRCRINYAKFIFPNPVSVMLWVLSDTTQFSGFTNPGRLLCRWSPSIAFYILHDKTNYRARLIYSKTTFYNKYSSNNMWPISNYYIGKWALLTGEINHMTVKVKINGNDIITLTDTVVFQETVEASTFHIGSDQNLNYSGFGGFIWYTAIFNQINKESSYLGALSTNCFSGSCSSCNPSFIIPSLGTGCGPDSADITKDSSGFNCASGYGCRNSLTIKCNCPSYSCEFTSANVCSCIDPSLGSKYQTACNCLSSIGQGCCHSDCSSCSAENECLTCKANFTRVLSGQCVCIDGYARNPSISLLSCLKCNPECDTCSSESFCTKCIDSLAVLSNGKCICPDGYFALITSTTFACMNCLFECKTCVDSLTCSLCKDEKASLSSGRCSCINGYFGNYSGGVLQNCIKCDDSCLKCSELSFCLSCISLNSAPVNGVCICYDEFWATSNLITADSCQPCQLPCKTCKSLDFCLSCLKQGQELVNGQCLCPLGSFETSNSCDICQFPCKTCSSLSFCLTCSKENYQPVDGKCFCPERFYENLESCKPCLSLCQTCNSSDYCFSCLKADYQVFNGKCFCPEGFYEDSGACIPCLDPCKTCSSSIHCLTCRIDTFLVINGSCHCPKGYYKQNDSCVQCLSPCETCLNSTFCLTCSPLYSTSINGRCACQDQYYNDSASTIDNLLCSSCISPCLTCLTSSKCLSCDDLKKSVDHQNVCKCIDGFFLDNNKECLPCNDTCATCSSNFRCSSCVNSSFDLIETGECLTKCPNNLIRIGTICSCRPGYRVQNDTCIKFFFSSKIKIDKSNKLSLTFSDDLNSSLTAEQVSINLDNRDFRNFELFVKSSKQVLIGLDLFRSVAKGTIVSIELKKPIYSRKNAILANYNLSGFLYEFEYIDPNFQTLNQKLATTTKTMVTVSIGMSIMSNPAAAWAIIGTLQLLPYIPLSENYNETVTKAFFTSVGGFNLLPNLMEYLLSDDSSMQPSSKVRSIGIETSVFWINIGKIVFPLIMLVILWPVILFLSRYKLGKLTLKLLKLLENYRYSVFLRFWIQAYLDIGVFSIINLKSVILSQSFNHSKPQFYVNQFSASLAIVRYTQFSVLLTPLVFLIFLINSYNEISDSQESTFLRFGTLFYEFKNNKGILSILFYLFYFLRRLQFLLTQFYLNSTELGQMTFNMCTGYFMVAYLIYFRPFKDAHIQISNLATEVTFTLIFTVYFIYSKDKSIVSEKIYQNFVIFTVISCISIQFLIAFLKFLITLKKIYLKLEELRNNLISYEIKIKLSNIEQRIQDL